MTLDASGSVIQRDDYYPFGLTFNSYTSGTENLYKFTGKEEQEETGWIDFGARMYMPDLGRWGVVDDEVERDYSLSPYNYAFNKPIAFIDPDGNWPWESKTVRTARKFARATGGKFSKIPKVSRKYFGGAVARVKISGTVVGDNVVQRYIHRVLNYNRGLTYEEYEQLGFVDFREGGNYGYLFDDSVKLANVGAIGIALESVVVLGILPPGVIGMDEKIDIEALTTLLFAQHGKGNKNYIQKKFKVYKKY